MNVKMNVNSPIDLRCLLFYLDTRKCKRKTFVFIKH